jgi:signal recognition particle subunit SRP54
VLIVDTAGRLAIDEAMMAEIRELHAQLKPIETLFVVDAMQGQDAVNTAKAFNEALPLTGVILTKLDGDARGGAALSVRHVTGKPLKFAGVGEKLTGSRLSTPSAWPAASSAWATCSAWSKRRNAASIRKRRRNSSRR